MTENWSHGNAYEHFMGRWSRLVAPRFVTWLHAAPDLRWVDAGCGSGALTSTVLDLASPASVLAVDSSAAFVEEAQRRIDDSRVTFDTLAAEDLPPDVCDVVVSGLVLNFVDDPLTAVTSMSGAAPGGTVAAYVWDYGGRMQLLRMFWDVACSLDASAIDQDEAQRFPLCEPDALTALWKQGGLTEVRTTGLEVTTEFRDFEDLWSPFLSGQGPAPGYVARLDDGARTRLRDELERMVHADQDGRIRLHARAWAVSGRAR